MPFFYRSHTGKIFKQKGSKKIYDAAIYAIPTLFMNSIQNFIANLINIFLQKSKRQSEKQISVKGGHFPPSPLPAA